MALSKVVLPVPVPPDTRMLRRVAIAVANPSASSDVTVPNPTSSSNVKRWVNLRIVNTGPEIAHGGNMAATREPSSSRASRIGCASEISSPQARAMFLTATVRFLGSSVLSASICRAPLRSTKTRRPPSLTITSVTEGSVSRSSIGLRNGRIRSRLLITFLGPRARNSLSARRDSAASGSSTVAARD